MSVYRTIGPLIFLLELVIKIFRKKYKRLDECLIQMLKICIIVFRSPGPKISKVSMW